MDSGEEGVVTRPAQCLLRFSPPLKLAADLFALVLAGAVHVPTSSVNVWVDPHSRGRGEDDVRRPLALEKAHRATDLRGMYPQWAQHALL